jgi:hypothetical protein
LAAAFLFGAACLAPAGLAAGVAFAAVVGLAGAGFAAGVAFTVAGFAAGAAFAAVAGFVATGVAAATGLALAVRCDTFAAAAVRAAVAAFTVAALAVAALADAAFTVAAFAVAALTPAAFAVAALTVAAFAVAAALAAAVARVRAASGEDGDPSVVDGVVPLRCDFPSRCVGTELVAFSSIRRREVPRAGARVGAPVTGSDPSTRRWSWWSELMHLTSVGGHSTCTPGERSGTHVNTP